MSVISDLTKRCSFVWTVERPLSRRRLFSPKFSVNSESFQLVYYVQGTVYEIYAYCSNICRFNVIVQVEAKNGLNLSYTLPYIHTTVNTSKLIWSYKEAEILKAVPDFLTDGIVNFRVMIDDPDRPCYEFTVQPSKEYCDKSVQKDEEMEEKSVQTPSHMDIAPCLENLSEDLSNLVEQDSHSDVVLSCGDRTVRAHRCVLSTRSRVFSAMLQSDMAEGRTGVVEIRDMDPSAFEQFVRYMYTGNLPCLTAETAKRFYEAADKYAVVGLARRCAGFLQENLEPQNACEMLTLADAHGDAEFKEAAMDYILQNEIPLREDDCWPDLCESRPKLAVEVFSRFCKYQKKK